MRRDYGVKILVPKPSDHLATRCRLLGLQAQETKSGQVVIKPKVDDEATVELSRGVTQVPGQLKPKVYQQPHFLADESAICYLLETQEAGRTGRVCYVAAGPNGERWTPYRLSRNPLFNDDWHAMTGHFTGKSLSRIEWHRPVAAEGETAKAVLSIDRATFELEEAHGLVLRRETLLHEHVVGNSATIPQLPEAVAAWQEAVAGLYGRLRCSAGCGELHYREPVTVSA